MGSNKRKTYSDDQQELDGKPCPVCGCSHFYISRAFAGRFAVHVSLKCRNCGDERQFKIKIQIGKPG